MRSTSSCATSRCCGAWRESPDPTRWRGEVKHVCGAMVTFYHFPFLRPPQFSRRCWPPLAALELHHAVMLLLFMFLSKSLLRPDLESFLCCQFGKDGKTSPRVFRSLFNARYGAIRRHGSATMLRSLSRLRERTGVGVGE